MRPGQIGGSAGGELFDGEDEQRLPWLGAEENEPGPRIDGARVLALLLACVVLLAALAGALYWLFWAPGDTQQMADGSVIEAPDTPYKTRPTDPGGVEVEGTGGVSFAISEGETREGRIAERPVLVDADPTDGAGNFSDAGGAIGVQVGAYPSQAAAQAGWSQLNVRVPALAGRGHRIVEGSTDGGATYWLQALAGSPVEADTLCRAIREDGGDCQVKR